MPPNSSALPATPLLRLPWSPSVRTQPGPETQIVDAHSTRPACTLPLPNRVIINNLRPICVIQIVQHCAQRVRLGTDRRNHHPPLPLAIVQILQDLVQRERAIRCRIPHIWKRPGLLQLQAIPHIRMERVLRPKTRNADDRKNIFRLSEIPSFYCIDRIGHKSYRDRKCLAS